MESKANKQEGDNDHALIGQTNNGKCIGHKGKVNSEKSTS